LILDYGFGCSAGFTSPLRYKITVEFFALLTTVTLLVKEPGEAAL
jgi:hypothetical protein